MRPPDEAQAGIEGEIISAQRALAKGKFLEARRHLADAERLGAPEKDVRMLESSITSKERWAKRDSAAARKRGKLAVWAGFGVAGLGYLILSIRQPADWPAMIWGSIAFGVVPVLAGLVAGLLSVASPSKARFSAGMKSTSLAMLAYTAISLMVLRFRVASGADSTQIFLVGCFVTMTYSLCAGLVAGFAAARLVNGAQGRTKK